MSGVARSKKALFDPRKNCEHSAWMMDRILTTDFTDFHGSAFAWPTADKWGMREILIRAIREIRGRSLLAVAAL